MLRHHAGVLLIGGFAQLGKAGLVVGEHQQMAFPRVLVMPRDAVLGAQPPDELKIIFAVLRAVFALGTRFDVEGKRIGLDAMPLEYLAMICGTVWRWKIR